MADTKIFWRRITFQWGGAEAAHMSTLSKNVYNGTESLGEMLWEEIVPQTNVFGKCNISHWFIILYTQFQDPNMFRN